MRCFEAEVFSGTVIEAVHSEGNLVRGNGIEAPLLRKERANQAVHILVRAAFPGGIGVSEVEVRVEFFGDTLVQGELLAAVGRQRVNMGDKRLQQREDGFRNRVCGFEREMRDQRVVGRALVHRDQSLLVSGTDHPIGIPVAEAAPLGHDHWAQIDGNRRGGMAPRRSRPPSRLPPGLLAAQGAVPRATGALVGIDLRVEAFVADGGLFIVAGSTGIAALDFFGSVFVRVAA